MTKRKCGCIYADAKNTQSVRDGYEMGGYLKHPCKDHTKAAWMNRSNATLWPYNHHFPAPHAAGERPHLLIEVSQEVLEAIGRG